jgi:hypothetical protein
MTVGVIVSLLAAGLAIGLARETRLRRALQALCNRLLAQLREPQGRHLGQPPTAGSRTGSTRRPRSNRR